MPAQRLVRIGSEDAYETPWFRVRKDTVRRPNGSRASYYVVVCPASSFVIPVTERLEVVMVRLFRYRTQRGGWEVPAGSVEEGEEPLSTAHRELAEEAGYAAGAMRELTPSFDSMNGVSDARAHVFVASDLSALRRENKDEETVTDVRAFPKEKIMRMIADGEIVDALSLAALLKYFAEK